MTEYPDIHSFPMLYRYCSLRDQLFTVKDHEAVKEICWTMISYARPAMAESEQYNAQMRQAAKESAEHYDFPYREPPYYSFVTAEPFKRFSIISEKQGDLPQAIWACRQAIALGLTDDRTKAGMQGRLDRLMKKV
jgi:hypothetical protein